MAGPAHRCIADTATARALFAPLAPLAVEVAAFAYLDAGRRLLGLRHLRTDSPDAIDLPIRSVAADALAFDAAALVMAHNHPSGDATPSIEDIDVTRRLARTLAPLEVRLIDHLILVPGGAASFRQMGLL